MDRVFFLSFLILSLSFPALAAGTDFATWLDGVRQEAREKGISDRTLDVALMDLKVLDRVIALDRKQPEGTLTFEEYLGRVLTRQKVEQGRRMLRQYSDILQDVEKVYGVQPRFVVALWGIETNYGSNTGGFNVIEALATLAYEGRRAEFFRRELIEALRILDQGHIAPSHMKGSWAGAMGQSQFMPSSFVNFAVDHDGDGRRDIWETHADVFASAANYLARSGWRGDETWGREVRLPKNLDPALIDYKNISKPIADWQRLGVRRADGRDLPTADMTASLVQPDGPGGKTYMIYNNYRTLLKWNRSLYFATTVGLLADRIVH